MFALLCSTWNSTLSGKNPEVLVLHLSISILSSFISYMVQMDGSGSESGCKVLEKEKISKEMHWFHFTAVWGQNMSSPVFLIKVNWSYKTLKTTANVCFSGTGRFCVAEPKTAALACLVHKVIISHIVSPLLGISTQQAWWWQMKLFVGGLKRLWALYGFECDIIFCDTFLHQFFCFPFEWKKLKL